MGIPWPYSWFIWSFFLLVFVLYLLCQNIMNLSLFFLLLFYFLQEGNYRFSLSFILKQWYKSSKRHTSQYPPISLFSPLSPFFDHLKKNIFLFLLFRLHSISLFQHLFQNKPCNNERDIIIIKMQEYNSKLEFRYHDQ